MLRMEANGQFEFEKINFKVTQSLIYGIKVCVHVKVNDQSKSPQTRESSQIIKIIRQIPRRSKCMGSRAPQFSVTALLALGRAYA